MNGTGGSFKEEFLEQKPSSFDENENIRMRTDLPIESNSALNSNSRKLFSKCEKVEANGIEKNSINKRMV